MMLFVFIWNGNRGKTKVHANTCPGFGSTFTFWCACLSRLVFGTVDALIWQLRAIFVAYGRGSDISDLPGFGNPGASKTDKDYMSSVGRSNFRRS